MLSSALSWHWRPSIPLMLLQVILVLPLRHTFTAGEDAETLMVHYVGTEFTKIQRIHLQASCVLTRLGCPHAKQISIDLSRV